MSFRQSAWLVFLSLCLLWASNADAAAISSTTTGGNWNATGTWVGGVVPTSTSDVTIAAGATVTVNGTFTVNSLTMANTGNAATLNFNAGANLTVTNGTALNEPSNSGTSSINVGTATFTTGSITYSAGNNNRNASLTISTGIVNVGGNVTFADQASQNFITFTGAGTLNIGGAFSASATGGGINFSGSSTVNFNAAGNQNIRSFAYDNLQISGSGTKTLVDGMTVGALTINNGDLNLNTKTLVLNGNLTSNNTTGSTISNGTLNLNGSTRTLTVNNTAGDPDLTISAVISGQAFNKAGAGVLLLSGTNTFQGGGVVTVNAGTLRVGAEANLGNTNNTVTVNSTGTLQLANMTTNRNFTINDGGTLSGTGTSTVQANNNVGGLITFQNTGTPTVKLNAPGATDRLIVNDTTGGTATGFVDMTGSGTVRLNGSSPNEIGTWIMDNGVTAEYTGGTGSVWGNIENDLIFRGGRVHTVGNDSTMGAHRDIQVDPSGGSWTVDAGITTTFFGLTNGTGNFTFNGGGTFDMDGNAGNNTLTGTVTVDGATLNLGQPAGAVAINGPLVIGTTAGSTVIQNASNVITDTVPVTVGTNGTWTMNNNSETIGSLAGTGTGTVAMGSATLTTGGNNSSTAYSGDITGTGNVVKTGNGTWTLSSALSYTGTTAVNAGTLLMNGSLAGGAGLTTVNNGGTLAGTGTVQALIVNSGGTVSPGNPAGSVGTFHAASADFSSGGKLHIQVPSSASSDVLALTGLMTLGGSSVLELDLTGFNPIPGQRLGIITYGSATAGQKFGSYTPATFSSQTVNVAYDRTNKRVNIAIGQSATPVKLLTFTASADGTGVLLDWTCASELQNLGFHVARRKFDSAAAPNADAAQQAAEPKTIATGRVQAPIDDDGWERVNRLLIPGRLNEPSGSHYTYYDQPEPGTYEYRLVSVAPTSVGTIFEKFPHVTLGETPADVTPAGLQARMQALNDAWDVARADDFAVANAVASLQTRTLNLPWPTTQTALENLPTPVSAKSATPTETPVENVSVALASLASAPEAQALPMAPTSTPNMASPIAQLGAVAVAARTVSNHTPVDNALKIVYQPAGVLLVPNEQLNGYNPNNVMITRGGVQAGALGRSANGLLLYGPGYEDAYTNRDVFFLRKQMNQTQVLPPVPAASLKGTPVTSLQSRETTYFRDVFYNFGLRPEENNYPPWYSTKYLSDSADQTFTVNTPSCTGGTGKLVVKIWTFKIETVNVLAHSLQAKLNGTSLGTVNWNGADGYFQLTFPVPANVLAATATQEVELYVPPLVSGPQLSVVYEISVEYPRVLEGPGPVHVKPLTPSGNALYEVKGLASGDVYVVDARVPSAARLVPYQATADGGTFRVRFAGSLAHLGDGYLIVEKGRENTPECVKARTITYPARSLAYFATGPEKYGDAIQPLLKQRGAEGLKGQFVEQESLFDAFNYGRYGPQGIFQGVRYAAPKYLVLLGRTTYDYKNYEGHNTDPQCPTWIEPSKFFAQAACDEVYGDLLGRGYPQIAVGRYPFDTPADLTAAVQHTLNYESPLTSERTGLIVADRLDKDAGDFPSEGDALAAGVPWVSWSKSYLATPSNAGDVNAALIDAGSNGPGAKDILVFIGHGASTHFGTDTVLSTNDSASFTGNAIFMFATCNANYFIANTPVGGGLPTMVEQLLSQPQGGLAMSIGSTTWVESDPNSRFIADLFTAARKAGRWGDALMIAQQNAYTHAAQSKLADLRAGFLDQVHTMSLLGDPGLPITAHPVKAAPKSAPAASSDF